jgi:VanZ family protein
MSTSVTPAPIAGKRSNTRRVASAWFPVLLCVFVISQESTAMFGADHTSEPLQHFFEFFFGHFTQPEWWRLHLIIRKCGHFTGYGILSVAWFRAFWMTVRIAESVRRRLFSAHALAIAGTLLVASADEFHQTFLPNRTGTPWDVLVDCSGAMLLQLFVWLWIRRRLSRSSAV